MLIVANPVSGRGRRGSGLLGEAVRDRLVERGVGATIHRTRESGDAQRIVRTALSDGSVCYDVIVACGGDGTVQEVAGAMASASATGRADVDRPAMGIIPAGRCNDLAHALNLTTDPAGIVEALLSSSAKPIDLGRVNGRYFCTVATLGFDAAVSRFVDGMAMPLTGTPAYLYGAVRVLMTYRPPPIVLEGDFGKLSVPVFLASSANTATYGGAIPIVPQADPTDGFLDVCVIESGSWVSRVATMLSVLKGRHGGRKGVRFLRTTRFSIESLSDPLEIWADGEHVADTPAVVDIVPEAVRIMTPVGGACVGGGAQRELERRAD